MTARTRTEHRSLPRLKNRHEFLKIQKSGQRYVAPAFLVQACFDLPYDGDSGPHIGFTASKKIGNAVARNRAKRRLRILADTILAQKGQPAGAYVFVARAAILSRSFGKLEEDLERALDFLNRPNKPEHTAKNNVGKNSGGKNEPALKTKKSRPAS